VRISVKPLDLRSILQESVLEIRVKPGREGYLESFESWVQDNVDRLNELAEIKKWTSAVGGPHHGAGR